MKRLVVAAAGLAFALAAACATSYGSVASAPTDAGPTDLDGGAPAPADVCADRPEALWVFGGSLADATGNVAGPSTSIFRASLRCDGSLGAWSVAQAMPVPLRTPNVGVLGGKLLLLDGLNESGGPPLSSTIWAYQHAPDGGLTGPAPNATTLTKRWRAAIAPTDDSILVLGGLDGNNADLSTIEMVQLSDAGAPTVTSLPPVPFPAAERLAAVALGGRLLVVTPTSPPEMTKLGGGALLWQAIPLAARMDYDVAAVVAGDHAYFIGGVADAKQISVATVTDDGATLVDGLRADRDLSGVAAVKAGDRIFLLGGSLGTGVVSGSPSPSGLGDLRAETSLPVALVEHAAVVY